MIVNICLIYKIFTNEFIIFNFKIVNDFKYIFNEQSKNIQAMLCLIKFKRYIIYYMYYLAKWRFVFTKGQ